MKDLINQYKLPFTIGTITVLIIYVLPICFIFPDEPIGDAILKSTMLIFMAILSILLFILLCVLMVMIGNLIMNLFHYIKDYLEYR